MKRKRQDSFNSKEMVSVRDQKSNSIEVRDSIYSPAGQNKANLTEMAHKVDRKVSGDGKQIIDTS